MGPWIKKAALSELDSLTKETNVLSKKQLPSADHARWYFKALTLLEEVFGRSSNYYIAFSSFTWSHRGLFVLTGQEVWDAQAAFEERNRDACLKQLEAAKGILQAARDHLKRSDIDSVYQGKDTGPEASVILKVINIAEHKLRKAVHGKPSREREIQDAFETLLIGADIPYSREKDSIEYSSKTYTPDFTIQKLDLAIEIKFCGREGREKEIIPEINDDILAYQTKYGNLLFLVYDMGHIRDVDRFTKDFEKNDSVIVRTVKH